MIYERYCPECGRLFMSTGNICATCNCATVDFKVPDDGQEKLFPDAQADTARSVLRYMMEANEAAEKAADAAARAADKKALEAKEAGIQLINYFKLLNGAGMMEEDDGVLCLPEYYALEEPEAIETID